MEFLAFVILVLGLIGASILRKHIREAKQLRLREIIHDERLKAMEHNVPLPDVDDGSLAAQFENANPGGRNGQSALTLGVLWIRIVALCVGLASFFGGLATAAAFFLVADPEFSDYWAMGFIPTFMGIGLLIFFAMSRSLGRLADSGS